MGGNGNKVNFFGYNYTDRVNNYRAISDYHWESYGGGSNFLLIPSGSPVLIEGHFSYSSYKIALEEANTAPRTSLINGFNMGFDFTYFIGKDELKYGIELLGFSTDYVFSNSLGVKVSQSQNTTELSTYVKYKKTVGKWLIEPGFRLQWYASLSDVSPEPRLALKYNATDNFRIKFAGGLYSQNLISAHSDRDIVNLFNGFLSGPDNLPDTFNGEPVKHNLQKSEHLILGFELDLSSKFTTNIEGYYKNFSQLTNINRQKLFDEDEYPDMPDVITKDFIIENGYAQGIDFTLKYDDRNLYVWIVYSLGGIT